MEYYDLSASAFSDEIDFNRSTISHLLSGRNKPSLDFVMKVLNRFPEVTISWFLYGKGNFPPNHEVEILEEKEDKNKNLEVSKESTVIRNEDKSPIQNLQEESVIDTLNHNSSGKAIKRIVIFYTDFSFETYEN